MTVHAVDPDSPSAAAGLQPGDVLVGIAGPESSPDQSLQPLLSCVDLATATAAAVTQGRAVELQVLRGEQERRTRIATTSRQPHAEHGSGTSG